MVQGTRHSAALSTPKCSLSCRNKESRKCSKLEGLRTNGPLIRSMTSWHAEFDGEAMVISSSSLRGCTSANFFSMELRTFRIIRHNVLFAFPQSPFLTAMIHAVVFSAIAFRLSCSSAVNTRAVTTTSSFAGPPCVPFVLEATLAFKPRPFHPPTGGLMVSDTDFLALSPGIGAVQPTRLNFLKLFFIVAPPSLDLPAALTSSPSTSASTSSVRSRWPMGSLRCSHARTAGGSWARRSGSEAASSMEKTL
mmetsp:Transcript_53280/g.133762  ORF Transcript_53280/g.133762 Transcript_53280/m.133762 type:complete len:250 (-) Transcript_53280:506-1255(-)